MLLQPPRSIPSCGAHAALGSAASVSFPASPGDTLEVFHALALLHSFPDETCRCRPGKRANAWPRAREPLPACWDLLKVCVSNPDWPGGGGGGAGRAAGRAMWLGREEWVLGPLPTGPPHVEGGPAPEEGSSRSERAREREEACGSAWGSPGVQNLEGLRAGHHLWGSILDSSTQRDKAHPSSWAAIHCQEPQVLGQGPYSAHGEAVMV